MLCLFWSHKGLKFISYDCLFFSYCPLLVFCILYYWKITYVKVKLSRNLMFNHSKRNLKMSLCSVVCLFVWMSVCTANPGLTVESRVLKYWHGIQISAKERYHPEIVLLSEYIFNYNIFFVYRANTYDEVVSLFKIGLVFFLHKNNDIV